MKFIAILMFLSTCVTFGQVAPSGPETPDLIVLKRSWSYVNAPALEEDPFAANNEVQQFIRDQRDTAVSNTIRAKEGQSREYVTRSPSGKNVAAAPSPSGGYAYRIKLKNTGLKTIAGLEWDYLFLDPVTSEESGRHTFRHEVKIHPGKEASLSGNSTFPPIRVVDAAKPAQAVDNRYTEKIVIRRIEYTDGSVWTRPAH